MDPISTIRAAAGLSQRDFAAKVGTSQPTIAAYERGTKSPTWSTIERIADAAGVEVHLVLSQPWSEGDRRNLALHRAVALALRREPDRVVARARQELARLHRRPPRGTTPAHRAAWREWDRLLRCPEAEIVAVLLDPSDHARTLRRHSPFRGAIKGQRRLQIMGEVSTEARARRGRQTRH